MGGKFKQ